MPLPATSCYNKYKYTEVFQRFAEAAHVWEASRWFAAVWPAVVLKGLGYVYKKENFVTLEACTVTHAAGYNKIYLLYMICQQRQSKAR